MRSVRAAWALLSAAGLAVAQAPVKLDVEASRHVMQAGAEVAVRIRLLDSENRPIKAPRRFDILPQVPAGFGRNQAAPYGGSGGGSIREGSDHRASRKRNGLHLGETCRNRCPE